MKTVTVTRDSEPPIDTTTSEAGTLAYTASTSSRGSARISVPLRTMPGVNGHAPQLSMIYDSARGSDITEVEFLEDDLGYGWHLQGLSRIQRCRSGLAGTGSPALTSTDTLCIDGQFLKVVSGSYWADGSVYRTESQTHVQVTKMPGDWFEVRFPDGRIARYGDTAASRVIGSGQFNGVYVWAQPSPTVVWAERHVTNPLGDIYTVDYEVNDPYGLIQPKTITYSGATVEFKYGPRSDTAPVYFFLSGGFSYVKRPSVLHTVRVKMNGVPVREYRLDSNLVAGRMQLEHIQECAYSVSGSGPVCLRPLVIGWSSVSGGTQNFPIAVSSVTDGLGARTEYTYAAVDTTSNPLIYSEAPFGTLPSPPSTIIAQPVAVVSEMRRSDGISAGAANRWTYGYKSYAYQDSLNRGYLGFHETRTRDEQTGIHSYTQHRIDGIFKGSPSQVRLFTNLFGSGNELERREIAYEAQSVTGGLVLPLAKRITIWRFEGSVVVGGSELEMSYCFRALSGDTCPSTGTEFEHPTQMSSTTTTGDIVSDDPYTPLFWGDVPNRTISAVKQTSVSSVTFQNGTLPWIKQLPIRQIITETAAGKPSRTVVNSNVFLTNTAILASRTQRDNDTPTRLTWTRTFTGNNPTQDCLDGSTFTCIATNYEAAYADDRYPPSVTNALNQATSLSWDPRFGAPTTVTDPDNNQTQTEYDPFGRVVRVVAVDGTTIDTDYESCDSVSCADVIGAQAAMKISIGVSNGGMQVSPGSARYVDVLGRVVLEEVEALDTLDGMRMVRTAYDPAGTGQVRVTTLLLQPDDA